MTATLRTQGNLGALAGLAIGVLSALPAPAVLFIDVGTHVLTPNTATPQFIDLFVENSGGSVRVSSFDLLLQIGDGLGTTPFIDSVDVVTGTIFQGNNSGVLEIKNPQSVYYGVAKGSSGAGPTISSESRTKIATIGIKTTGYSGGTLPLDIWGFQELFTSFYSDDGLFEPIPAELMNGFIQVAVPEPGEWAALTGAGLFGLALWRRRSARK